LITAEEIVKKTRKIEIKSKWLANHVFSGSYHSAFKGSGMRFKEVREYQAGDEERFIDWNVTARMGHHFTKVFEEERELPVYILADVSASTLFGTLQSKRELMCRICADLSYSAISNNDKTGLLIFADKVEKFVPPQKRPEHILYMLKELLAAQPFSIKTDFVKALDFLNNIVSHRSMVFIISDFFGEGYENALGIVSNKHDVLGIQVFDKLDKELPNVGWLQVKDIETGKMALLNTRRPSVRNSYSRRFQQMSEYTSAVFKKTGTGLLTLETGKEYIHLLQQSFLQRKK